jgi:outer membrane protein assembly factor BamB
MGETIVIDLGELREPAQSPRPAGRVTRERRTVLILVAAVLVAALGGASPWPTPITPVVIPTAPGDVLFLNADRYYVVSPGGYVLTPDGYASEAAAPARTLSVYRLPDARRLAHLPLAVPGPVISVVAAGDVLLVSHLAASGDAPVTVGVDAGTGRSRWQQAADFLALSPSGRTALLYDTGQGIGAPRWLAVDPATGLTRWTYAVRRRDVAELSWDGKEPGQFVTARWDGRVEVRDLETGALAVAADLPVPVARTDAGPRIWATGDLLLLDESDGVTAYGLDRLDRRWRSDVDLTGSHLMLPCGGGLCFSGAAGGLHVLDPATGRLRWSSPRWLVPVDVDGRLLAAVGDEEPDGGEVVVLDPATGGRLGSLGMWQLAGEARPDGRVVGLRPRSSSREVVFALLDPAALTVRVLGRATDVVGDCQVTAGALICRRLDASVAVWRLP